VSDLDQLRDLSNQIRPPSFDSLVSTARRRQRRTAGATAAACTALVVAIGAGAYAGRGDQSSAPVPADHPSVNAQSSVFDPDEPTLPGGVRVLSQDVDGFVKVEAGRHAVRVSDSLLYQFDLPEDSEVNGGQFVNPGRERGGDTIVFLFPTDKRMGLPVHPCRDHTLRVVGPTVGDLAGALSRLPYLQVTKPVEVTVGGMDGLFVKVTVPDDADIAKCQDDQVHITSEDGQGSGVQEPGLVDRMWILDIDGTRHILLGRTFGDTKLDARLVTRLVQSITFTRG
jgi:hypothetical protein